MATASFILLMSFIAIGGLIFHDQKDYPHFKTLKSTEARQRKFRKWVVVSFLIFGVGGLLGLWMIGHLNALWSMPEILASQVSISAEPADGDSLLVKSLRSVGSGFSIAVFSGLLLSPLLHGWMQAAKTESGHPVVIGDIESLMPRNGAERFWALVISLNAGFSEEVFYRLLLPVCIVIVSGNIWLAIIGSTLLFGITHLYQGWAGVMGTTVFGAICMLMYLTTKSIWLVIALHALLDANALLITPWLAGRLIQRRQAHKSIRDKAAGE